MWPKWLANTLDRSSRSTRPHAVARQPHVADVAIPPVDDSRSGARADDWELATGFRIHLGYERSDFDA